MTKNFPGALLTVPFCPIPFCPVRVVLDCGAEAAAEVGVVAEVEKCPEGSKVSDGFEVGGRELKDCEPSRKDALRGCVGVTPEDGVELEEGGPLGPGNVFSVVVYTNR